MEILLSVRSGSQGQKTHFVNFQQHKSTFNKFFPQLMIINKMIKINMQKIKNEKIEEILSW